MISFKNSLETQNLSEEELEYLNELKTDIENSLPEDCEAQYAISDFCLSVRLFDLGRYSFIYPIALSERADEMAALLSVNEYAMREEIERIFTDVPKECLQLFIESFRHLDIDAETASADSFRVKVKTECELLDEILDFHFDGISLTSLREDDTENYARLLRDEKTNKFWGYDFREDFSENVPDSFFIENAVLEFRRGLAITLAVRFDGKFIGEATLYAFDGMGSAEIAIRLLPKASGRGLGKSTFKAIAEYAKRIGLIRLSAYVDKRNSKSLKYCSSLMEKCDETPDRVKFSLNLY
ncbi:MAG: GNAT family N-acetyltransferase [Clostridia bacterium]|nr:GNAT family N-acetyltransferase [Clostridia bacterium]